MTMTQEYSSADVRIEHDSMGTVEVPQQALWRAQTERARHNFQFSSLRFPRVFIQALAHIKAAAAATNAAAGVLTTQQADAIIAARSEEHTSELQSRPHLVCRLLLEKKKKTKNH